MSSFVRLAASQHAILGTLACSPWLQAGIVHVYYTAVLDKIQLSQVYTQVLHICKP
jgi:hypothetical protein